MRFILNIYGPYLGAGIKMEYIAPDWRQARVSMRLRWYNRNAVGTHFGGSLYTMVDPQLMLMLMNILGSDYIVWDKSAEIDFIKPGKGKVFAEFEISDDDIDSIKAVTQAGQKYLPQFTVHVRNEQQEVVATIKKVLYIRRKMP